MDDKYRALVGLVVGRSLVSAGFAFVQLGFADLLLKIENGDAKAMSDTMARVSQLNSISSLFVSPMVGSAIDSFGRKPALVGGTLLSASARGLVGLFPSRRNYFVYRILNLIGLTAVMQSVPAVVADTLGGRASVDYKEFDRKLWMWLAVVRLASTQLASKMKAEETGVLLASACGVVASAVFAATLKESLVERREFKIRSATNPFGFYEFFTRTRELETLAFVLVLRNFPWNNNSSPRLFREKFDWTIKERANLTQIANMCEIFMPAVKSFVDERMSEERVLVWSHRMEALADLNTHFTTKPWTVYLNPFLTSVFDGERSAASRLVARASADVNPGEGELSSACSNLSFLNSLVLPDFFNYLYDTPAGPFLLTGILNLTLSELILPKTFKAIP